MMIEGRDAVLAALTDEAMIVPPAPATDGPPSLTWLRARVVRFSEGLDREHRRRQVEAVLAGLDPERLREAAFASARQATNDDADTVARTVPVRVLAEAMGLTVDVADVAAVARQYLLGPQPEESTVEADAAVARLAEAIGTDDEAVARITVLVQSCEATARLIINSATADIDETLRQNPPARTTRRLSTLDGSIATVDLASAGLWFGAGRHACPGVDQARAIATGVLEARTKM